MISCEDELCFNIIETSKTNDFSEGFLSTSWKKLTEKFESTSKEDRFLEKINSRHYRLIRINIQKYK